MESLITILIPCRNEEKFIRPCLHSVLEFVLPIGVQIEIILLDGRSTDSTRELIEEIATHDARVRWVDNPGITQSFALNLGIRQARGQWVMRLDAHTEYPPDYLSLCYATAIRTGAANVGGICLTQAGGTGYQALLVQALTTHKFGVGDSGFRTGAGEGPRDTVPFGFFRREIFEQIGRFDERLVRAQDYEFNRRIGASGRVVWLNPAIRSRYFNQPTLSAFYHKQAVREAPYNAYMWHLAPYSFTLRHAITGAFAAGIIGGFILAPLSRWIAWPFIAVIALYGLLAMGAAIQQAVRYRQPRHVLTLPACFFIYHFSHGLGLLIGLLRLAIGSSPVQKIKEPWPGAGFSRIRP